MRRLLRTWDELELLTGLMVGEAADQPWEGKVGVAYTAYTRVQNPGHWNWGHNWREVILCPKQFSCFDDHNIQRIRIAYSEKNEIWQECQCVAHAVYLRQITSSLGSPTHYHRFDCDPTWDDHMEYLGRAGDHLFYSCF